MDFHNFVFSMKASNPVVMIQGYRLLAAEMYRLEIAVYLVSRRGLLMTAGTFLTGTVSAGTTRCTSG